MAKANFDNDIKTLYRIDSGSLSSNPELGRRFYTLTCGNSDGFGFYENGVHKMVASNFSIEVVGSNNKKTPLDGSDVYSPAKIIFAENGDIVLEAIAGDLILKGNNVYIKADGSEQGEGRIEINANDDLICEGKDISIVGTSNARFAAYGDVVVGGKVSTNINGGMTSIAEQSSFDFLGSIITGDIFSPSKFLDTFKNLLNNNIF